MIITVKNLSKKFKIPHQKRSTLKEHFTGLFQRTSYDSFAALSNVNFEVKEGEFLGIIGKNGSGKSTLLKILAGIYKPNKGRVSVKGSISPFLELGVGFNGELTARDNVYLNGTILGLSKKEIDGKYDEIVNFAELEGFMDMKIKNFSSGMHVRLAFSIAIQADADVFLCDEVLAVGDMEFQQKCFDVFYRLKNMGKTIVFVSHDIQAVRRFCTRTILMEHGKLIDYGKTEEVIEKYIYSNGDEDESKINLIEDPEDKTHLSNKKAEIDCIKLLDKNDKPKNIFSAGSKLKVKANYKINDQKIKNLAAGIAIYNENGDYLFGDTSIWNKVLYSKNEGEIIVEIASLPLLSGRYFLTFAISSENLEDQYDWVNKKISFTVENTTLKLGSIDFPTIWK